jgi:hypothetical protein
MGLGFGLVVIFGYHIVGFELFLRLNFAGHTLGLVIWLAVIHHFE